MKKYYPLLVGGLLCVGGLQAQSVKDSLRTYDMEEAVVTGTRNATDVRHLPMTVSVVGRDQIERSYESSLLPILTEQVPGLFVTSRGVMGYGVSTGAAGGMSLRGVGGSPTTGLLVLIDGHPQYMGLMGHPIADAAQSMLAEKVEIVRGPASVLYGSNALGGVINIVTRQQHEDGVKTRARVGYGSWNTLTAEASNQVRKGRFTSVVTASYDRTDGHRPDMGFEQYGGYAKVGYAFHPVWNVLADVNLTHFNASNPGLVASPLFDNDSRITRGMASLALENNGNRFMGALKLFANWGQHRINDGYKAGSSPLNYRFNSHDRLMGLTWYQSTSFFRGNRVTVGIDYQHMGGEAWNKFLDGSRADIADRSEDEVAGYVDFRQAVGDRLVLDAGVRIDQHSQSGTVWIPQAGVSLNLLKDAQLKAMASKGFRNPTLRELYMFGPRNPELRPERVMNYEISWTHRLPAQGLSYGVNVFYLRAGNLIQAVQTENGSRNLNTGEMRNWGVEADISYRLSPSWRLSGNYSWLHTDKALLMAPRHKLYAGAEYARGRWNLSSGVQYVGRLTTSLAAGTEENFVLWNFRGSFRASRLLDLFARGENLLALRYEINAGYPMPRATFTGGVDIRF